MTTDKTKLCHSSSSTMRCSHVSEGKNRGQYVMHCSCLTCLPKLPLQVWWGPAEASWYVDEVNLMNGWMDKNTAQCTLTQVYSLYLQVTQALLTLSKQKQQKKHAAYSISNSICICTETYPSFRPASPSLLACGISSEYSSCGINCRSIKQHSDDQKAFGWLGFFGFAFFFF